MQKFMNPIVNDSKSHI